MKDLNYPGDLGNDIKLSNAKFNWIKGILSKFTLYGAIYTAILLVVLFTLVPYIAINIPLKLSLFLLPTIANAAWSSFYDKKEFDKKKEEALDRLDELTYELYKKGIHVLTNTIRNSKVQEKALTGQQSGRDGKIINWESTDRKIYLLDLYNQLQVLNEKINLTKKKSIISSQNIIDFSSLTLYEEDELSEVENNVEITEDNELKLILTQNPKKKDKTNIFEQLYAGILYDSRREKR